MDDDRSAMSRRRLLGAGAGVAAAVAVSRVTPAGASVTPSLAGNIEALTGAAILPTRTLTLGAADFVASAFDAATAQNWALDTGGIRTNAAAFLNVHGPVRLPVGSTITAISWLMDGGGGTDSGTPLRLESYNPVSRTTTVLASAGYASPAGPQTISRAVANHVVNDVLSYRVTFDAMYGAAALYGVKITYKAALGFIALSPVPRVFNTRDSAAPKLSSGEERIVPLGVPGTATAAVFNLTVTETEGAGYVACFPANVVWPGNSNINWSGPNSNLANTTLSTVDSLGQMKVRGGANKTHVIIDVLGYFA